MKIRNNGKGSLTILNGLGKDRHLILKPGEESIQVIPTKELLDKLLRHHSTLELIVANSQELSMIGNMDYRSTSILKFESNEELVDKESEVRNCFIEEGIEITDELEAWIKENPNATESEIDAKILDL